MGAALLYVCECLYARVCVSVRVVTSAHHFGKESRWLSSPRQRQRQRAWWAHCKGVKTLTVTPASTTSNSLESIVRQRRRHRSQCRNFNERNIKLASILTYVHTHIHVYVCMLVRISLWECVHSSSSSWAEPWMRWGAAGGYSGRDSTCNSYKYVFTCRISCVSASILQMSRWRWDCTLSSRVELRLWLNSCDEITVAVAVLATVQHGGGNEWRMSLAVRRPVSTALAVHFSFFLPLAKQLLLSYFLHFPYYVFVGPLSLSPSLFLSVAWNFHFSRKSA